MPVCVIQLRYCCLDSLQSSYLLVPFQTELISYRSTLRFLADKLAPFLSADCLYLRQLKLLCFVFHLFVRQISLLWESAHGALLDRFSSEKEVLVEFLGLRKVKLRYPQQIPKLQSFWGLNAALKLLDFLFFLVSMIISLKYFRVIELLLSLKLNVCSL